MLADDLPAVRGDALLLGQVLSSLLANAIEALDREGQITVRGDWVRGQSHVTLERRRQRAGHDAARSSAGPASPSTPPSRAAWVWAWRWRGA